MNEFNEQDQETPFQKAARFYHARALLGIYGGEEGQDILEDSEDEGALGLLVDGLSPEEIEEAKEEGLRRASQGISATELIIIDESEEGGQIQ